MLSPEVDALGRVRRFPHVDNRLPCAVYIEVPIERASAAAAVYIAAVAMRCGARLTPTHNAPHISITRSFTLRRAEVDEFVAGLRRQVCCVPTFNISLADASIFVNDDRSASFLGLLVDVGLVHILKLLSVADATLAHFGKAPFYDPPEPHASVAWAQGDITDGGSRHDTASVTPICNDSNAKFPARSEVAVECNAPGDNPLAGPAAKPARCVRVTAAELVHEHGKSGQLDDSVLLVSWHVTSVCVRVAGRVVRLPLH